jgi:cation-transporting ATPase I
MLYAGSSIVAGTGTAVAVAVGEATGLGRSAEATRGGRRLGGVHARLAQLTRQTAPLALGAGAAVIGGGTLRGRPVRDVLGTGVSLAVAAVPESLPIIATAAQYSAARRLSQRNALVRNPGTIEALGRVDVLCFDKTGTLTRGKIRLHRVWTPSGEQPLRELAADGKAALAIGLRATPQRHDGEPLPHPTDRAIVKGGIQAGVHDRLGAPRWRQVGELPFEPSRGYHAVLGRTADGMLLCAKGAPEIVLARCARLRSEHGCDRPVDNPECGDGAFAVRAHRASLWSVGVFSNRYLLLAVAAELAIAAVLVFASPLKSLLGTAALPVHYLVLLIPYPLIVWGADELRKLLVRRSLAAAQDDLDV